MNGSSVEVRPTPRTEATVQKDSLPSTAPQTALDSLFAAMFQATMASPSTNPVTSSTAAQVTSSVKGIPSSSVAPVVSSADSTQRVQSGQAADVKGNPAQTTRGNLMPTPTNRVFGQMLAASGANHLGGANASKQLPSEQTPLKQLPSEHLASQQLLSKLPSKSIGVGVLANGSTHGVPVTTAAVSTTRTTAAAGDSTLPQVAPPGLRAAHGIYAAADTTNHPSLQPPALPAAVTELTTLTSKVTASRDASSSFKSTPVSPHRSSIGNSTGQLTTEQAANMANLSGSVAGTPPVQVGQTGSSTPETVHFGDLNSLFNAATMTVQNAGSDQQQLQLQVEPKDMGSLMISVAQSTNGLSVQVQANQMQTVQWLTQHVEALQSHMQEQGINVSGIAITFGDASLGGGNRETPSQRKSRASELTVAGSPKPSNAIMAQPATVVPLQSSGWSGKTYNAWV